MSKTVTIPTDGMNPFVVIFNGVKYVYTPGETVEVPDGVALEIEEYKRWREKHPGENVPPFGAQPDLSQNDPNAADYVKNRTHYEEFKTIIEEREVRAWIMGGEFDASRMPQVGEKLTVTLNGNTYKCTVWESRQEGEVCLGNGDFDSISDRGENVPFAIRFWVNGEEVLATISTVSIGDNTISIVDDSGNALLEETFNIAINVDAPMYSADFALDQPLIVGNTYKVVYDGVPYECVAWDAGDYICLGNGEIDGSEHSEDVPFLIGTYSPNNELVWYLTFYGTDSHTISVSGMVVHKLDPKYMPPEEYDLVVGFVCQNGQSNIDVDSFRVLSGSARKVIDLLKANKSVKVALVGERYDAEEGERLTAIYHPTSFWVQNNSSFNMSWDMWVHEYNPTEGKKGMMLIINRDNSIGVHRGE